MAFIFLQEDPKVAVANENDDPTTIPTPIQLGSLLVVTSGDGLNGHLYAAVPNVGVPAWVSVGLGTGAAVAGSGTPNRVAKFITPTTIGDAQIEDITGGSVVISAATSATMLANNGPATVTSIGASSQLLAVGGSAFVTSTGAGNATLIQSDDDVNIVGGTGVNVTATTGDVVVQANAADTVAILNPNASIAVGAGGSNNNIDIAATTAGAAVTINSSPTAGVIINNIPFLGEFLVANLPPLVGLAAVAFATDLRNLDSGAAYPNIQAGGAGTGGFAIRGTDGVWRLSGTNIVAQA